MHFYHIKPTEDSFIIWLNNLRKFNLWDCLQCDSKEPIEVFSRIIFPDKKEWIFKIHNAVYAILLDPNFHPEAPYELNIRHFLDEKAKDDSFHELVMNAPIWNEIVKINPFCKRGDGGELFNHITGGWD